MVFFRFVDFYLKHSLEKIPLDELALKPKVEEFFADQERSLMFGIRSSVGNKTTSGGIYDKVVTQALGQIVNYTTATGIAESDFLDHR